MIVEMRATHLVYQYMVLGVQKLSAYPVSESPNLNLIFPQFRNNCYWEIIDNMDSLELRDYVIKKIIVTVIVKVNWCYGTEIQVEYQDNDSRICYVYVCEKVIRV